MVLRERPSFDASARSGTPVPLKALRSSALGDHRDSLARNTARDNVTQQSPANRRNRVAESQSAGFGQTDCAIAKAGIRRCVLA
jgi:hypothetical protein